MSTGSFLFSQDEENTGRGGWVQRGREGARGGKKGVSAERQEGARGGRSAYALHICLSLKLSPDSTDLPKASVLFEIEIHC